MTEQSEQEEATSKRSRKTKAAPPRRRESSGPKPLDPIPKGFHSVTPYLVVNDGAAAIEFYKKAFGAQEISRHTTSDGKKILNAQLKIGDSMVLLADEFPGSETRSPLSIGTSTVMLHIYTVNVDRVWNQAIEAGARIAMPIANQFWGERYGQLADPFGHRWSVSQQIKMSDEEMQGLEKAAMEMFGRGEHPQQGERKEEEPPTGVA